MKTTITSIALACASLALLTNCGPEGQSEKKLKSFAGASTSTAKEEIHAETADGSEIAVLTDAPDVPPPLTRKNPTKVIVHLEVKEVVKRLADGVDYTFWTFGGNVPGKFIRIREGDYVEFHLANHPDNKMPHNIDLHAVTGPGGGAASTNTAPGHETAFSFTALNPGLYIYHCATAPVGMHIANGMYGLILVEPKEGLPPVDRELYIMQSEFYTQGPYGEPGLQPFDMNKAIREDADYVVFNGSVGSLTGDNAPVMKAGETVRLYVGNIGPNLVSSFHVIGEIFDKVYAEGGSWVNTNVQSTVVPAGGSTMIEFKVEVPGTYILVDHSIFRAFNKGALGMLKVEGPDNILVYSNNQSNTIYQPKADGVQTTPQQSQSQSLAQNKITPPVQKKVQPPTQKKAAPPVQKKVKPPAQKKAAPPVQKKVKPQVQNKIEAPAQKKAEPLVQNKIEPPAPNKAEPVAKSKAERIKYGKIVYNQVCITCHQAEGQGIAYAFPPLAKSDYLNDDMPRAVSTVIHGMTGKVTVNGQNFNSIMPPLNLSDEAIANALTYIYSKWNNNGTEVTTKIVEAVREKGADAAQGTTD